MDKFKLFILETHYSLEQLYSKLIESTKNVDSTFELHPLRKNSNKFIFNFIEKKIIETLILDKHGQEQTIEYLHIDSFSFHIEIRNNKLFLLLKNPPRSLKFFKQTLAEIFEYQISISEERIDPLVWLRRVEKHFNNEFLIISMEIKDIIFNSKTNGTLTLKSQIDLRDKYIEIVNSNNYRICKILVNNNDYFKGKFILSSDSSFQLDCFNSQELLESLLEHFLV
ncbi:hypothetical protein N3K59_01635 [Acinetobacter baumannii]|uniref:hypothetical protein n=1 Tax=Acinetobacter baumannii TaxID=470 RepID=UPI0020CE4C57|nr:hypothetical protein [Acinetobacter baumannii]ELY0556732.1 hypothetical protein [Acinetobacter baumannii]MCQ1077511.1 hypothetical protein [Acinetobacter baumannii]MCT2599785.1 hypothetical protein [Acinetobacter baumannii]HAV5442066.1 hypothetical protein [Acinetobacter baumannii]HDQ1900262.1 hypothetical protein [Acinetobacter baumannii]